MSLVSAECDKNCLETLKPIVHLNSAPVLVLINSSRLGNFPKMTINVELNGKKKTVL